MLATKYHALHALFRTSQSSHRVRLKPSVPGVDYESMLSELGKFGASFILATQSLSKLDDLSRTMRDTLLANVGCLAVFQVAGSDARQLAWELGRDRVSEDDMTSLSVYH